MRCCQEACSWSMKSIRQKTVSWNDWINCSKATTSVYSEGKAGKRSQQRQVSAWSPPWTPPETSAKSNSPLPSATVSPKSGSSPSPIHSTSSMPNKTSKPWSNTNFPSSLPNNNSATSSMPLWRSTTANLLASMESWTSFLLWEILVGFVSLCWRVRVHGNNGIIGVWGYWLLKVSTLWAINRSSSIN